jgi:hypothetical protein
MNTTIHKFNLETVDTQIIRCHEIVRWLLLDDQYGGIFAWAEVNIDTPAKHRTVLCRGTRHHLTGNEGTHVGSIVRNHFVWHFFEEAS